MDRDSLAGYAGREQSSVKHFLLESYLERLVMIIAQGRYSCVAYVDAFAGPWQSSREDLSDTSFAKAIDVMQGCRTLLATRFARRVSFRALFVEREAERYARLKRFADGRSVDGFEVTAINEDFATSTESVARWIRDDEMGFVLLDPTGWKDVIAPTTLAPLLRKRNVEMLINVMWNFINLASAHVSQEQNLRDVFGDDFPTLIAQGGGPRGANWMRAYLRKLRTIADDLNTSHRLRTAWFPVEFPTQHRVFYYLTYVTHHVKGLIVFLQESERALRFQQEVKFVVRQQRREAQTGMPDMFGDELKLSETSSDSEWMARSQWLVLLPTSGSEARVDETRIADMAEECGCLISHLQAALRGLIAGGVLQNVDARRPRPKNPVNYSRGETIRRVS